MLGIPACARTVRSEKYLAMMIPRMFFQAAQMGGVEVLLMASKWGPCLATAKSVLSTQM